MFVEIIVVDVPKMLFSGIQCLLEKHNKKARIDLKEAKGIQ